MMVKIISLFLIAMAVLAMFGRMRFPSAPTLKARKCSDCGAPVIGRGPCRCKDTTGS